MQHELLIRTILFFLVTICFTLALQQSSDVPKKSHEKVHQSGYEAAMRTRRATKKPGFFRTLFSVIYEQWNDTKNTFRTVNNMINDNFLPDNQPVTESPTSSDPNASTTPAPFKITRSELSKILRRNLRGLKKLFDIELQEALQESKKTFVEMRKNASLEISKFL